ncbi:endonuclease/exonuclease/phosphatase family protein [Pontibacter sp. 13R65]|uniref:endonuclease/exonuclease/phosphatase family protein n=1 Tax=Pontibacter sp. 13R65 TaxID=3127458 RepID=UPI00301C8381
MKRYPAYFAFLLLLILSACGSAPWEDYTPPVPRLDGGPTDPTVPTEPGEPEDPTGEDAPALRVMSFGLNGGNANPTGVAALINDHNADFVVLREVDSFNTRSGITIDQGEEIAKLTGMHYFFAKGIDYREGAYGTGVLSRFPIEEARAELLAIDPKPTAEGGLGGETRPLAIIRVKVEDDLELVFAGTNLDDGSNADRRGANRPLQANQILNTLKDLQVPIILAGNFYFQTQQNDAALQLLYNLFVPGCTGCELTFPANNPTFVADHIMIKASDKTDLQVQSYTIGSTPINNRVPVIADIKISQKP